MPAERQAPADEFAADALEQVRQGLFTRGGRATLLETAPGVSIAEVIRATEADLAIARPLRGQNINLRSLDAVEHDEGK